MKICQGLILFSCLALSLFLTGCSDSSNSASALGYVEAEWVYVASPQSGWLVETQAREGDLITIGEVLFQLDSSNQSAALAEAEARVLQSRAELLNLSTGVAAGVESYDCSGKSLLFSPDYGVDLGINHIINFNDYDLSLSADSSYRDEQGTNFLFLEDTVADKYVTLNLEATLMSADEAWAFSLYVRNVTDERFFTNTNTNNRGLTYSIYNAPQNYGARLRYNF